MMTGGAGEGRVGDRGWRRKNRCCSTPQEEVGARPHQVSEGRKEGYG